MRLVLRSSYSFWLWPWILTSKRKLRLRLIEYSKTGDCLISTTGVLCHTLLPRWKRFCGMSITSISCILPSHFSLWWRTCDRWQPPNPQGKLLFWSAGQLDSEKWFTWNSCPTSEHRRRFLFGISNSQKLCCHSQHLVKWCLHISELGVRIRCIDQGHVPRWNPLSRTRNIQARTPPTVNSTRTQMTHTISYSVSVEGPAPS